jgi:hypothetical protein
LALLVHQRRLPDPDNGRRKKAQEGSEKQWENQPGKDRR